MDLDFHSRFKTAIEEMDKYGEEYALAKSKSYYTQEMSKVILSRIQSSFGDIAVSKAEVLAKASQDYEKHLKDTEKAVYLEHSIKNKLEVAKAKFEGNRSLSSLEKATRNLSP